MRQWHASVVPHNRQTWIERACSVNNSHASSVTRCSALAQAIFQIIKSAKNFMALHRSRHTSNPHTSPLLPSSNKRDEVGKTHQKNARKTTIGTRKHEGITEKNFSYPSREHLRQVKTVAPRNPLYVLALQPGLWSIERSVKRETTPFDLPSVNQLVPLQSTGGHEVAHTFEVLEENPSHVQSDGGRHASIPRGLHNSSLVVEEPFQQRQVQSVQRVASDRHSCKKKLGETNH